MLFPGRNLVARIEAAEHRLIADSVMAATRRRALPEAFVREIAGGAACFVEPGSPLNKVVGLGFGGVPDDGRLAGLEAAYDAVGVPVQVELANLADPAVGTALTRRGYRLLGFENVLGRPLAAGRAGPAAAGITIETCAADRLEPWLDVVVGGFARPNSEGLPAHEEFSRDLLAATITDMAGVAGFRRYLARRDGEPAGGASLRMCAGVAHLCGAATLPEHRRQGVQTSLLGARLAAAADSGCDVAVVVTQPGSKSQQNAQRQGFALLYTRAILLRDDPA